MGRSKRGTEAMVRNAFDLLLEIRAHPQANRLLLMAIGFLKTLVRQTRAETAPIVVAVQTVRLRDT